MKIAMKPLTLAKTRRAAEHSSFQRFSFQRFSFTQSPLFPRNPLFPALRSSPSAVQEPPAKSKFLAISPFIQGDFGSGVVTIRKGERKLELDFND